MSDIIQAGDNSTLHFFKQFDSIPHSNSGCPDIEALANGDETKFSLTFAILFGIPATVIIIITVVGNLMVLCFKARVGKRQTTLLIWNLGLADFLVGIVVLPLGVAYVIQRRWAFGRIICKIWSALDVIFVTASIVTLCVISIDRYIGVTKPLKYKQIVTKNRIVIAIVVIWVFSITILLATMSYERKECYNDHICQVSEELQYVVHSVITAFLLPAMVTLVLYWKIYSIAKQRELGLRQGLMMALGGNFLTTCIQEPLRVHCGKDNISQQQRVIKMHKKVAKTLGVVVSAFLFCWLPFFVLYLISYHCACIPHTLLDILSWLGYCNSMINPIIYAFTVDEFKRTVKSFWDRCRGAEPMWDRAQQKYLNTPRISTAAQGRVYQREDSMQVDNGISLVDSEKSRRKSSTPLLHQYTLNDVNNLPPKKPKDTIVVQQTFQGTDHHQQWSAKLYTMLVNSHATDL